MVEREDYKEYAVVLLLKPEFIPGIYEDIINKIVASNMWPSHGVYYF